MVGKVRRHHGKVQAPMPQLRVWLRGEEGWASAGRRGAPKGHVDTAILYLQNREMSSWAGP